MSNQWYVVYLLENKKCDLLAQLTKLRICLKWTNKDSIGREAKCQIKCINEELKVVKELLKNFAGEEP